MPRRSSQTREVLRLLGREVTPFVMLRLAAVILLVISAAMLMALGPVALKLLVDLFARHESRSAFMPVLLVALYVSSQWLIRAGDEVRALLYWRIERRISSTLSERFFAHLMHLPLRFHLERHTGAVSETLTNGLEGLQIILQHLVFTVLPVTAELLTVVAVLTHTAPPMILAFFCGALLFYSASFTYSAISLSESATAASAARVEAGAAITDGLFNYETVKYFCAESLVQKRVAQALTRTETAWVTFSRRFARNGLLVASVFAAFLAVTTWYAMIEVLDGHMTIGSFVLVNVYMLQLASPVEMLGSAFQGFSQGLGMLERMLGLFRETPESALQFRSGAPTASGTLEFARVSLSYLKDRAVLTDISFSIPAKRTLGIVGPSGSGKSTIVRLLMRLLDPDEGEILLDDVPISQLALAQLRNSIAVVPQDTILLNDTIAYNIAFGRPRATHAEIQHAASIARLHDFIVAMPDGYDTCVGERGIKLSGGERQRVSIARAVLKAPRMYVFDEATSSLDSGTEQDILASLREIAQQSSTMIIAHRLSTVVHADQIVVLEDGRVTERGTHTELLRQGGRYAALWSAQNLGAAA